MEALAKIPQHVTFIMDGNGRWAQQRGLERSRGHVEGVESVRAILEASLEWGIKYVSFFAFSEENWGRPEAEVNTLMSLMFRAMLDELDTLKRYGVHFVVLGNRSRLDEALNETEAPSCSCLPLKVLVDSVDWQGHDYDSVCELQREVGHRTGFEAYGRRRRGEHRALSFDLGHSGPRPACQDFR